jgi:hypothetical protein
MDPQAVTYIKEIEKLLIRASRNDTCLIPGCSSQPIGSHVIARKTLEHIADSSKVFTWDTKPSAWKIARTIDAFQPLEDPTRVGIDDDHKVKYPLFCSTHDGPVFAPLEVEEFTCTPEQVFLLAYRGACYKTYHGPMLEAFFEVARRHGYQPSLDTPERREKLARFRAADILLDVRKRYEQIRETKDYQQLGWSIYPVNMQPCVAATNTFLFVHGSDADAIVNGAQTITAEDFISFSLLPYKPLNNCICIISWFRGSQRARRFMNLSGVNELTEKQQQDMFRSLTFEASIVYISPTWWESLSGEQRTEYKKLHHEAGRKHAHLV